MNAELIAIRDNLRCSNCLSLFQGSDSQAWHVKYEKQRVFCSEACRFADARRRLCIPIPNRGPCKTCGESFFSRSAKIYCSLKCYCNSEQFKAMQVRNMENNKSADVRAKIAATLRTGEQIQCLECSREFYRKLHQRGIRKFCSRVCYRSFMTKRFDRWIANPEEMSLPQCYDEFLDRQELNCIVGDCGWKGAHLSLHVNQAHGLPADELKRAAGFNLNTGLIAKPLAEAYQARALVGVAVNSRKYQPFSLELSIAARASGGTGYRSQESYEHAAKARALMISRVGPVRICKGCGIEFTQSTPVGRTLFHSVDCRSAAYSRLIKAGRKTRVRQPDGTFKWIGGEQ